MADKQPPQTTMPPVTVPPAYTTMPPVLPQGTAIGGLGGPEIAFGEADEKRFSIGFKREGKGGNVHLFVNHPDGKVEFFKAEVSADGKLKTTTHGLKTESRQDFSAADIGSKLLTNERELAQKAGPIIALAKKIYHQDSPGVITPDEFLNIYKAFQALGPAEVPSTMPPPQTTPPMTTPPPPMTTPPMTTPPPPMTTPPMTTPPPPFKYENNSALENGKLTQAALYAADAKAGQLIDNAAKKGVEKAQGDTAGLQMEVAGKIAEGLAKKGFLSDAVDGAAAQTGLPKLPRGPKGID